MSCGNLTSGPALDAVTAAMADFLGCCDEASPNGARLHYPPPDQPHPVGAQAQRDKLQQAQRLAGAVPVIAYAHSYGPLADVQARFALAVQASQQPGASGRVWINRYGYLSDAKLAALGAVVQGAVVQAAVVQAAVVQAAHQ